MKKNIKLNKNIIKALSIGISASMMLQPMTAFAGTATDENTLNLNPDTEEGATATVVSPEAQIEAEVTTEKTTDVAPAIDKVEAVIAQADELTVTTNAIDNAADKLETELGLDNNKVSDAEDDMDQINADLALVETADGAVANKVTEINGYAQDAQDAATAATNIQTAIDNEVNTVAGLVEEATTAVSEARSGIANAGTTDEANAAMSGVEEKVNAANTAVTTAETNLATAEENFTAEQGKYNQAVEAYEAAVSELATAKTNFDTAQNTAVEDAQAAEDELQRLADKAEKLAKEADNAKKAYERSGYAYIAALETKLAEADAKNDGTGKIAFTEARKLVKAIVEFYYVPDVLKGSEANLDIQNWNVISKNNFTYTDENGNVSARTSGGDVLNYGVLTYKDADGNEQVKYINYKTANANSTDNYGGLVIFEKTAHAVYEGKDIPADTLKKLNDGEAVEFNGDLLIKNGDSYVGFDTAAANTEVKVDPATADVTEYNNISEETGLGSKLEVTKEETSWNYDAEKETLTKTVTKDYTETTYTGAGLAGQAATLDSKTASENQYKAELQEIINGLDENSTFTIGEKTFKKGDTADLTGYDEKTHFDVTGYKVVGTYQDKEVKTEEVSSHHVYTSRQDARDAFNNNDNLHEDLKTWKSDSFLGFGGYYEGEKEISETRDSDSLHTDGIEVTIPFTDTKVGVYSYIGNVTVEYQKIESISVDKYFAIFKIANDGTEEQRKQAVINNIVANGGTFIDFIELDGNFGSASILYIPGHSTGEDGVVINKTDAIDSVEKATAEFNKDKHNSNVEVTAVGVTKYGYSPISVIIETIRKTEGAVVAEQVWNEIAGESEVQLRNDKWYTGDVILAENWNANGADYTTDGVQPGSDAEVSLSEAQETKTADFRQKVDSAAAIAKKYADLSAKARESKEAVLTAKQNVKTIENKIAALEASVDHSQLGQFTADLATAKATLAAAITARDTLLEDLDAAKSELQVRVAALTPAVTPSTGVETAEEAPAQVTTPANAPAASTTPVNQGGEEAEDTEGAGEEAETTEPEAVANTENRDIVDEGPALAAAPVSDKTIEDEDTALASMPEAQQMSWWWLLLILVLGTTGAEMYRRHMVKKNAAKAESTDNQ